MSARYEELVGLCVRGLPFTRPSETTSVLLELALACRMHRASGLGEHDLDVEALLTPDEALTLWPNAPSVPETPLNDTQMAQVEDSIRRIKAALPEWSSNFDLPMNYRILEDDTSSISASAPFWPQHILLADHAFASPDELREQVLHEWCHQWLYLLEEITPLERDSTRSMVLPSGTSDRSPREVLGAAHVAAALAQLYALDASKTGHRTAIVQYGLGCVRLLDPPGEPILTEAGKCVSQQIEGVLSDCDE